MLFIILLLLKQFICWKKLCWKIVLFQCWKKYFTLWLISVLVSVFLFSTALHTVMSSYNSNAAQFCSTVWHKKVAFKKLTSLAYARAVMLMSHCTPCGGSSESQGHRSPLPDLADKTCGLPDIYFKKFAIFGSEICFISTSTTRDVFCLMAFDQCNKLLEKASVVIPHECRYSACQAITKFWTQKFQLKRKYSAVWSRCLFKSL